MIGDDVANEQRPAGIPEGSNRTPPLSGRDLLDLYIFQQTRADNSLSTEREIVIRNYSILGAILLLQTGALTSIFSPPILAVCSGTFLIAVSAASRVMSIYYARYTLALSVDAKMTQKGVIRGKNSLYVEKKATERNVSRLYEDAEKRPWRDFCTNQGALATINLLPGAIGLVLLFAGLILIYRA